MNRTFRLMVLGNDSRLCTFLQGYLHHHGYGAITGPCETGVEAKVKEEQPDLVIFDTAPRPGDTWSLFHELRASYLGPIIILTEAERDRVADQKTMLLPDGYVDKPIDPQNLLAKIRSLLKRFHGIRSRHDMGEHQERPELHFGGLRINRPSRKVQYQEKTIHLSSTEFDLLTLLAGHAGKVLDRDTINRRLRGIPYDGLDRSVDVAVSRLRKKLGDSNAPTTRIKTVWGQGYLFAHDGWD